MDSDIQLARDRSGNLIAEKKEAEEDKVKRLKKEMYALEDRLIQLDKESNESYLRDKKEKQLKAEKRFIPDG